MQTILITPHFKSEKIDRFLVTATLSSFLLDFAYLTVTCAYPIKEVESNFLEEIVDKYLTLGDKLILTGGSSFGENKLRDAFEMLLIKKALVRNMPILGICRGLQILNIYFGGTLQDVPVKNHRQPAKHFRGNTPLVLEDYSTDPIHLIKLNLDTKLPFFDQNENYMVNSIHTQGIAELANNFVSEAHSEDGTVELVSDLAKKIIGVQWHPELGLDTKLNQDLLKFWLSL